LSYFVHGRASRIGTSEAAPLKELAVRAGVAQPGVFLADLSRQVDQDKDTLVGLMDTPRATRWSDQAPV
jgi:hypothetical protein